MVIYVVFILAFSMSLFMCKQTYHTNTHTEYSRVAYIFKGRLTLAGCHVMGMCLCLSVCFQNHKIFIQCLCVYRISKMC